MALHAANLKRAEVRLVIVPGMAAQRQGFGWSGYRLGPINALIPLTVYNSGAKGSLLVNATVEVSGHSNLVWTVHEATFRDAHTGSGALPSVLAAGALSHIELALRLLVAGKHNPASREQLVEIIDELGREAVLDITITYQNVKGFSLLPWRVGRPLVSKRRLTRQLCRATLMVVARRAGATLPSPRHLS